MPAIERELAFLFKSAVAQTETIPNVLIVSSSSANGNFTAALGSSTKPFFSDMNELLEGGKWLGYFDCIIVDNSLQSADMLDDEKRLAQFIEASLALLRSDSLLVIRENLEKNKDRNMVAKLTHFLDVYRSDCNESQCLGFDFYAVKNISDSIYKEGNWMDFAWLLRKKCFKKENEQMVTFRDFLEKTQYTSSGISAYEWIFGSGFISPGGAKENMKFLNQLNIKPGQLMLDVGVGIGGSTRQVAEEFGGHVIGVDLSSNMCSIAMDRADRLKDARVQFLITDVLKYEFPAQTFDFVYSRDCLQHLDDVLEAFRRFFRWLKPGGKMLITTYAKGSEPFLKEFAEYIKNRHYNLKTKNDLEEIAKSVGFCDVQVENMTERFKQILNNEIANAEQNKAEFLKLFSAEKYGNLMEGWKSKLSYIDAGNHCWLCISAQKP